MRAADLKFGAWYTVKVGKEVVPVQLTAVHPLGGYVALNPATGRNIRLFSAKRIRQEVADASGSILKSERKGAG